MENMSNSNQGHRDGPQIQAAASRLLDVLTEQDLVGYGTTARDWRSAVFAACSYLFGVDARIASRINGPDDREAYNRYQIALCAIHLLEDAELVKVHRQDQQPDGLITRISLAG